MRLILFAGDGWKGWSAYAAGQEGSRDLWRGGSIGRAVARAFAREGARVFLAGRTASKLDRVAAEIRVSGGAAETAVVDALDERAVEAFVDGAASQAGNVDISFSAISYGDVQKPLMEI